MNPVTLEARILAGREHKARRFARALWDQWKPSEALAELAKLERRPREFWKQLADSIGAREPSVDTVELILKKLRVAVAPLL